jgi:hypothetical protein
MRNAYRILFGKPEGKTKLGRPRCRLANDIKTALKEECLEGVDWIYLAHDRNLW